MILENTNESNNFYFDRLNKKVLTLFYLLKV